MSEENREVVVPETQAATTVKSLEKRLNEFQEKVDGGLSAIMTQLSSLKPVEPAAVVKEDAGPDEQTPIPPKWITAVHEILGPEFECEVSQPDSGGTLFRVIVPKDKSNASQMHYSMHKRDVRTREIGNSGLSGVQEWCKRIRANLQKTGTKLIQYP